ncbi:potassium channel subfamily K member 13 [Antennarius striatus]|uniref:potassium channel subfamily K member 13 n=1 Tax=Antennarius striatus TaxID=241820 RepID=UPI0035ADCD11
MRQHCSCCLPSLSPSRETACFYLLFVLIAIYMLVGAAIFSFLEGPAEIQAHQLWERRVRDFSHEHNLSSEDLKSLLLHYEEARTAGIRPEQGRALWDVPGAFYFVGTVISTIGFGVTAPSTVTGKVLLVFYGLLGCSAAMLFFNLFLERVLTFLSLLIFWCHGRITGHRGMEDRDSEDSRNEEWKPSAYQVTLMVFMAAMLVACGAACLYTAMEGWTYSESLYFCFVAFSTVGFGDFVSGQRAHHEDTWLYQVANCLLMLFGVCWTYSLFNIISVIIRQGLNWMLAVLLWLHNSFCQYRLTLFLKLGLCDSEQPIRHSKNITPSGVDKDPCDRVHVKTVCNRMSQKFLQHETRKIILC